jgi:hypothetical protein
VCVLDEQQVHGEDMTEITNLKVEQSLNNHVTALIPHNPDNCENKNKCYYMFSVSNKDSKDSKVFSMRIELEFYDPGNVDLEKKYENIVQHG